MISGVPVLLFSEQKGPSCLLAAHADSSFVLEGSRSGGFGVRDGLWWSTALNSRVRTIRLLSNVA